jgi:hypothetical protein
MSTTQSKITIGCLVRNTSSGFSGTVIGMLPGGDCEGDESCDLEIAPVSGGSHYIIPLSYAKFVSPPVALSLFEKKLKPHNPPYPSINDIAKHLIKNLEVLDGPVEIHRCQIFTKGPYEHDKETEEKVLKLLNIPESKFNLSITSIKPVSHNQQGRLEISLTRSEQSI